MGYEVIVATFDEFFRITEGIAMSDVVGWILTFMAGFVVFRLVDNMQTSLERHGMLKEVEDSFTKLFNSSIAIKMKNEDTEKQKYEKIFVRSVLHDESDWQFITDESGETAKYKIIEKQRYVKIREKSTKGNEMYGEWISTQALHELTLKCRRIEKMYKSGIIKRIDLADMFREIVPLGTSGRLQYFSKYYSDYDAECIAYLVLQTIVSSYKYKNNDIVNDFAKYYKKHPEIHVYFSNNRRKRWFFDIVAFQKFQSIIKNAVTD